jgi:hypothetical protein
MDRTVYIHTTISMRKCFQCSSIIQTFYTSRYLCTALLLTLCCQFGRLYFKLKCFTPFRAVTYNYASTSTLHYKKAASLFCDFPTCRPPKSPVLCLLLKSSRGRLITHNSHLTKFFFSLSTFRPHVVIYKSCKLQISFLRCGFMYLI